VAGDVSLAFMAETIGQQLKQAREAKNLTIQKVVQATHIRAYQIEVIEADDFESLPSPVQARAYLRLYAEFLGLTFDEIIARQRIGFDEIHEAPATPAPVPVEQTAPIIETDTEPVPVETQTVGDKLNGLLTRIKQLVLRRKVQTMPMEPVEESNLLEPFETENEGLAAPLEEISSPAPEVHGALPSQAFFTTIGKTLRQRRESLSMTLDEIERHTHVRKLYLQALEAGEFDRLPSSVQARGMLNNYARFLDLDVDALLLTFAEGLQTQRLERQAEPDETHQKPASKSSYKNNLPFKIKIPAAIRRYLTMDIFVGGGLVLILLTFAIWGTSRIINLRAGSTPQPTAPSISNILVSIPEAVTASPTTTTTGNGSSSVTPVAGETLVLTLPPAGQGPVQVVVIAQEEAWVRVTVDGKVQFEGRVTAGTAYSYDGNTLIEVLTGNGRAISILYNQNNLGPMGNFGDVVDHIYTANAILNPTATSTPSPTITPTPTVTLRPSATPRPSPTPRITPTPIQ
jgi:cytoskeletal protein RodZ